MSAVRTLQQFREDLCALILLLPASALDLRLNLVEQFFADYSFMCVLDYKPFVFGILDLLLALVRDLDFLVP